MLITILTELRIREKIDQCTYEPGDLMAIALQTYLCGGEDYPDMAMFAEHPVENSGCYLYRLESVMGHILEAVYAALGTDYVQAMRSRAWQKESWTS